jgi:antitoxin component YwqK of YwqJK toxin-antitoxin module
MAKAKTKTKRTSRTVLHKDGSLWARGFMKGDLMDGPWKWYRKDGSLMRAGSFENEVQVGEWVTYAKDGRIVKVTRFSKK